MICKNCSGSAMGSQNLHFGVIACVLSRSAYGVVPDEFHFAYRLFAAGSILGRSVFDMGSTGLILFRSGLDLWATGSISQGLRVSGRSLKGLRQGLRVSGRSPGLGVSVSQCLRVSGSQGLRVSGSQVLRVSGSQGLRVSVSRLQSACCTSRWRS